jgi:hypothetical protein
VVLQSLANGGASFGAELELHELLSRSLSLGLRVSLGWSQINMDHLFKLI